MLSYSFSLACPTSERVSFLQKAREAFGIGLLTKAEGELVTSQQELHTLLKAAYSITVTEKWLGTPKEVVVKAAEACQQALGNFYKYSQSNVEDKDGLCVEIIHQVTRVKHLLGVEAFTNSDKGSFIPDSYRNVKDFSVNFTLEGFSKILEGFQKYHASLCETMKGLKGNEGNEENNQNLTALNTTMGTVSTESCMEAAKQKPKSSDSSNVPRSLNAVLAPVPKNTGNLGSALQKLSMSSSGAPQPSSSVHESGCRRGASISDESNIPTETDDEDDSFQQFEDENKKETPQSHNTGISSHLVQKSMYSKVNQAELETEDWITDVSGVENTESLHSLSQLALKSSSSSFSESFGSQSSWEKISIGQRSPMFEKALPGHLLKPSTESSCSDGSFFVMETLDSESSYLPGEVADQKKAEGPLPKPQPLDNHEGVSTTESSGESSFEMLDQNENGHQSNEVTAPEKAPSNMNAFCYTCLYHSTAALPDKQFELSHQDYLALLAGICHECLLRRLCSKEKRFQLQNILTAYSKSISEKAGTYYPVIISVD